MHNFTCLNVQKRIKILGDSDRGAIIIEVGNILAVLFNVCEEYGETIKTLRNFILEKVKKINGN